MENDYQIFGSKSSKDIDVMVFVDFLSTIDENHKFIKECNEYFKEKFDTIKELNCNLGILKEGMLVDVFKGTFDECNNSLFFTYPLHSLNYRQHIERVYDRGSSSEFYHIKMKRVARFLLSFFSREPELRVEIKEALFGDFNKRLEVLKKIDFLKYREFPKKKELHEDIYKTVAFQFGQIFGISNGVNVYTKEDAASFDERLSKFLFREPLDDADLEYLNILLDRFIQLGEDESLLMSSHLE